VLAALAAGRWVVTRRYVDRSHKNGEWSSPRAFVCNDLVLKHQEQRRQGCFARMRVLFLMENRTKCSVYSRVVSAGGGIVIHDWNVDELLIVKPGMTLSLIF
jgi:hypothetical protein